MSILDTSVIRTNPFGANLTGENSYKRAERITAALHILTNHVREDEPIREMIRECGLELLDSILDLRSGFRAIGSEKGQTTLAIIRRLISLVRMLAIAGYVSVQNANTVAEALDELGSLIVVSQRSTLAEQFALSRADLTPSVGSSTHVSRIDRQHGAFERRAAPRPTAPLGGESPTPAANRASIDNARTAQIMDILKVGGMLGIKDIASNLPQYSEKMIQRELAELVQNGLVQKIGEKRWSKYGLVG